MTYMTAGSEIDMSSSAAHYLLPFQDEAADKINISLALLLEHRSEILGHIRRVAHVMCIYVKRP